MLLPRTFTYRSFEDLPSSINLIFLVFFTLLLVLNVNGQSKSAVVNSNIVQDSLHKVEKVNNLMDSTRLLPKFAFKIGLWPLINPVRTSVDLGIEARIQSKWSVDLEVGRYFASRYLANDDGESYLGWRVRPGFKYALKRSFIGLILKYEDAINEQYMALARQDGRYTEVRLVPRHIKRHGAQFRFGLPLILDRKGRIILETFVRLGLQRIEVEFDIPEDAVLDGVYSFDRDDRHEYDEGVWPRTDFYLGMNLAIALW